MSQVVTDPFETTIRSAGEDWLIDWFAPREQALPDLRDRLAAAEVVARERLGGNAPRLSPDAIVAEYKVNPSKVRAFLQVLSSVETPALLVMVWRILQGMNILSVELHYQLEQEFVMRIVLRSPYGEPDEEYQSNNIGDAVVLRHLGIMKMDGKPAFDGFYPLNLT